MVELVPDKKKFIVRRICVCKGIEEEEDNTHALHRKRTKMNTKTQGSEGYHCYTRGSKKEQQDITRARWEGRGRKENSPSFNNVFSRICRRIKKNPEQMDPDGQKKKKYNRLLADYLS